MQLPSRRAVAASLTFGAIAAAGVHIAVQQYTRYTMRLPGGPPEYALLEGHAGLSLAACQTRAEIRAHAVALETVRISPDATCKSGRKVLVGRMTGAIACESNICRRPMSWRLAP